MDPEGNSLKYYSFIHMLMIKVSALSWALGDMARSTNDTLNYVIRLKYAESFLFDILGGFY